MAQARPFEVRCPDFTKSGFRTREEAETWISSLTECSHEHVIIDTRENG
jgi:hypothetical protein